MHERIADDDQIVEGQQWCELKPRVDGESDRKAITLLNHRLTGRPVPHNSTTTTTAFRGDGHNVKRLGRCRTVCQGKTPQPRGRQMAEVLTTVEKRAISTAAVEELLFGVIRLTADGPDSVKWPEEIATPESPLADPRRAGVAHPKGFDLQVVGQGHFSWHRRRMCPSDFGAHELSTG